MGQFMKVEACPHNYDQTFELAENNELNPSLLAINRKSRISPGLVSLLGDVLFMAQFVLGGRSNIF
jgi:hypothetical protein